MGKEITFGEFIGEKIKNYRKNKKKIPQLTVDESIKYHSLKWDHKSINWFFVLFYPIYFWVYGGLFVIVSKFAYNLDFSLIILKVVMSISTIRVWSLIILILILVEIYLNFLDSKHNKRLYESIIKERKKK